MSLPRPRRPSLRPPPLRGGCAHLLPSGSSERPPPPRDHPGPRRRTAASPPPPGSCPEGPGPPRPATPSAGRPRGLDSEGQPKPRPARPPHRAALAPGTESPPRSPSLNPDRAGHLGSPRAVAPGCALTERARLADSGRARGSSTLRRPCGRGARLWGEAAEQISPGPQAGSG